MKTIGIFSRTYSDTHHKALSGIFKSIQNVSGKVLIYKNLYDKIVKRINIQNFVGTFENHNQLRDNADFLISLGGDGTLLEAVTFVRDSNIPVLGINIGRLGFLSSIESSDVKSAIDGIFDNKFVLSERTLLRLKKISNMELPETPFAVNDITISKKESNSMIIIHTYVNDKYLNSYWADGLITATPTGSTAYSLSCNGPILTPEAKNFIITPIAPHNLSVRPLVISDNSIIKHIIEPRNKHFYLTLDSKTHTVKSNAEIIIEKENFTIKLAELPDNDFFQIIRDKLHWGTDKRN